MGVVFARVEGRDRVISVARNEERALDEADVGETADVVRDDAADASAPAQQ
jgi:hypothetical protein